MFSGKSSELVRRVRRHSLQQREVLVIKYCFDTHYTKEDKMSTHDRVMMDACSAGRQRSLCGDGSDTRSIGSRDSPWFRRHWVSASEAAPHRSTEEGEER